MPTYDGSNIFGAANKTRMELNPSAQQINEFFGSSGLQSLYGGGRGRVFLVEGVLTAPTIGDLQGQIATWISYDDGIGRDFSHPVYGTWPKVIFARWSPGERILFGYALPYKAMFNGLV